MTTRERTELVLKMAAPYLAVGIFWVVFHNSWLAILAYHAQILLWSRFKLPGVVRPKWALTSLFIIPCLFAGPALFFILPYIKDIQLASWLTHNNLSGISFVVMIFYFGIVHPVLEQVHWAPLREQTPLAHFAFAGYHMIVLSSLLTVPWLVAVFGVLVFASFVWQRMARDAESLVPSIASHIAADFGIIITAWLVAS